MFSAVCCAMTLMKGTSWNVWSDTYILKVVPEIPTQHNFTHRCDNKRPSPFVLFLHFLFFCSPAQTLQESRLWCGDRVVEKHPPSPVCRSVLCAAQLWMPLFSLSSLCRTHRARILISNGAKRKQTVAPACLMAHVPSPTPICQRKQTWDRTTCWGKKLPRSEVLSLGSGWLGGCWCYFKQSRDRTCRFKKTPVQREHEVHKGPSWVIIFLIKWHQDMALRLECRALWNHACEDYTYLQGVEILWRSFCLFPRVFPKYAKVLRCCR